MKFTRDEIVDAAYEKYQKDICIDRLDEAMRCKTFDEAVQLLIDDTLYWDGGFHGVQNSK